MKRTIIALALTFIALSCYSGTDDTGLQVYTIKGSEMIGMDLVNSGEDTKNSQIFQNLFNTGDGIMTFYEGGGSSVNVEYEPPITPAIFMDCMTCGEGSALSSPEVNFYSYFTGTSTVNINAFFTNNSTVYKRFVFTWLGGSSTMANKEMVRVFFSPYNKKHYIYTTTKLFTSEPFMGTTSEITTAPWNPTVSGSLGYYATDAKMFKNRIFVSTGSGNTPSKPGIIYYSNALDYGDFSALPNKGGVISLPYTCYSMESTNYGLYFFTSAGIFLLSGSEQPSSWKLEKITDLVSVTSTGRTFSKNDVVYVMRSGGTFQPNSLEELVAISGYNFKSVSYLKYGAIFNSKTGFGISEVSDGIIGYQFGVSTCNTYDINKGGMGIRTDISSGCASYRYNVLFSSTPFNTFKLKQKTLNAFYPEFGGNNYLHKQNQFIYESSKLTFGNPGSQKEISRIEYDYWWYNTTPSTYYLTPFVGYQSDSSDEMNRVFCSIKPGISSTALYRYEFRQPVKTFIWNAPIKVPSKRFNFGIMSNASTSGKTAQQFFLKEIRIYYRDLGAYKK